MSILYFLIFFYKEKSDIRYFPGAVFTGFWKKWNHIARPFPLTMLKIKLSSSSNKSTFSALNINALKNPKIAGKIPKLALSGHDLYNSYVFIPTMYTKGLQLEVGTFVSFDRLSLNKSEVFHFIGIPTLIFVCNFVFFFLH